MKQFEACDIISVRKKPGGATRGVMTFAGNQFHCALGRGGLTRFKREGDGATPAGRYQLLHVFFRADRVRRPLTALPVSIISQKDGWCDAPGDPNYNRHVILPYPASREVLWRDDNLYDILVVLDQNLRPRKRGGGSAIFLHIAKPGYLSTEGCVAVSLPAMRRLLATTGDSAFLCIE